MTTLILPEACINKPKEFHSDKWLEQSKFCSLCREECTHEKHHRYKDISWKEIYRWETKTGRKKSEEWNKAALPVAHLQFQPRVRQ